MKKILSYVMVLSMLLLCACGNSGDAVDSTEISETVSMYDLRTAMLAADDTFPDMLSVSDSDSKPETLFSYISDDFDYDKIEHFFISYSSDTNDPAGEIVVIAVKDTADLDAAVNALNAHVEHRVKMYEQYDPDSVSKVQKAVVFKQAQYAVLIISDKSEAVRNAFEDFVGK